MNLIQIHEFQPMTTAQDIPGYKTISSEVFQALERFAESEGQQDILDFLSITWKKGIGKVITAKNHVGIIALRNGTVIEILPKINSVIPDDEQGTKAKALLIQMLKTLNNMPYRSIQTTQMDLARMNIFEIFIRMFVDEVFAIGKRGLKCSYHPIEENVNFFKGKMIFSQQIKYNHTHAERCYVEYDTFSANRAENRLLKSTLLYLYRHSTSSRNRKDIKIALSFFSEIDVSQNYDLDFSRCTVDRSMAAYQDALLWSRVFLKGKSFTSYHGEAISMALLFPMEKLFESYVAAMLKKELGSDQYQIAVQHSKYYLFDEPEHRFQLRPDIVVTRKSDGAVFVMDTKWKLLSESSSHYGISQADMYQMYAYQKKYQAEKVILLYPATNTSLDDKPLYFSADDGVLVRAAFVDLFKIKESMKKVAQELSSGPL